MAATPNTAPASNQPRHIVWEARLAGAFSFGAVMAKYEPIEAANVDAMLDRFAAIADKSSWFAAAAYLLERIGTEAPPSVDHQWCDERLLGQLRLHLVLGEYSRATEVLFSSTPERVAASHRGLETAVFALPLPPEQIARLKERRLFTVRQVVRNRATVAQEIYAVAMAEALETPLCRVLPLRDANSFERERGALTLGDLLQIRPSEIEVVPHIGANSKEAIARLIRSVGLKLSSEMVKWIPKAEMTEAPGPSSGERKRAGGPGH